MNLIQLEKINKTYGKGDTKTPVLRNINLTVKEGEFVAIMGPSGSGKTTLMNVIGLLDKPNTGHYLLEGRQTGDLKDKALAGLRRETIGFVFQNFSLLGRLNTQQNIALPMIYNRLGWRQRRRLSKQLLKLVGLENRGHHKPNQLSGGQMQRVSIARALSNNPKIILADEPTGNLDTKTGTTIMRILRKLNNRGTTVIVVTHDEVIANEASRIIHIRDGKIVHSLRRRS